MISKILAIFDLQVTRSFLQTLESIGLSVQEKKPKIDFQDGCHGGHLRFSISNDFSYFLFTSHPDASYLVKCQTAFRFRRRSEK